MAQNDPSSAWQANIHQRILDGDPIAFAELCDKAIEPITQYLMGSDNRSVDDLCRSIVHDTLLNYHLNPTKFDPERGKLFPYLRMDARGDLKNLLSSQSNAEEKIIRFEDSNVEEWLGGRNNIQEDRELTEWIEDMADQSAEDFFKEFRDKFDDQEWAVIQEWVIDGNRETEPIALILRIETEDNEIQRKEVKRYKDKLQKKMQRFGERKRRKK